MTEKSRIAPHSQPRLSFSISPTAFAMLDSLKSKGLWGISRAAVARGLLYKSLQQLVQIDKINLGGKP